jgi:hypothetical protein
MLAVLETTKGLYTVNLTKILFFYPIKSGKAARLEMEDGTLVDLVEPYDDVNKKLIAAGVSLPI